ncbi:MAG: 16S rRNA (guanine(527)-N(7))-methyltransferase RsmG [Deltaproteobacteria bacterium]|nr:16S rRNA (guanine(527)-N(7))-methyltransferase RsmG [Deltaproteobacteria bacterium]
MTRLVKALAGLGLDRSIAEKLRDFNALFSKWNASINLSAARSPSDVDDHILDSLHLVPHLTELGRVIDVGSGGGFPVVVAAICCPAINFVALEPVHKKHAFLRTAARELVLVNLEAFAARVDDHDVHDYDAATSRATFDLPEWFATGLTLVRPGGRVFGFEAVPRDDLPPGFERHPYALDDKSRAIVVVRRPA